jgi:Flp pilus assembly pilin Flp
MGRASKWARAHAPTRMVDGLRRQEGQTTAEYALVLLVAGLIVGVFATFVKSGSLADMFHTIVSQLIHNARG